MQAGTRGRLTSVIAAVALRFTIGIAALTLTIAAATAQTFTTLYSFHGADGSGPLSPLIIGADGALYGVTAAGGTNGAGTVFRLTTAGALTTLYSWSGTGTDGSGPHGPLAQTSDGSLFGVTQFGGAYNLGTIFQIAPTGSFQTLWSFEGYPNDGSIPASGLILAPDGNLYGTTYSGGTDYLFDYGTLFNVTPSGTYTSLILFTDGQFYDGSNPSGPLTLGSDGILYGTCPQSREGDINGVIYSYSPSAGYRSLFILPTGDTSYGTINNGTMRASNGVLYTTAYQGGAYGDGVVFSNGFNVLHAFNGADGSTPNCVLLQGGDGNLYGTTDGGGQYGYGTIFRMTPSGTVTTLYSFTGGVDGAGGCAGLVQAGDGSIYGVTYSGGANGHGTVYRLTQHSATALDRLTVGINPIPGSKTVDGNVVLTSASTTPVVVTLQCSNPAASVPSTVTVPAGSVHARFPIQTIPVSTITSGTLSATLNGATKSLILRVRPIGIARVGLNPNLVVGGKSVIGTAVLEFPAAPGNILVSLSSSDPAVARPAVNSITIPAGTQSTRFSITTHPVSAATSVAIYASANKIKKGKTLVVNP
ncbi:MAG TPA: choice-of-anchor tandem repeat GloVer-containing protein [Chthonomonadaceae bacterium]|nr:choice-of-anchor tandem repeat GloVer-containing protein [Chthonomonadaceae bacterium]